MLREVLIQQLVKEGGFARTAPIIYVMNHCQARLQAQVHAGVLDSSAKVVPARLLELAAEDFLPACRHTHPSALLDVKRPHCMAVLQRSDFQKAVCLWSWCWHKHLEVLLLFGGVPALDIGTREA